MSPVVTATPKARSEPKRDDSLLFLTREERRDVQASLNNWIQSTGKQNEIKLLTQDTIFGHKSQNVLGIFKANNQAAISEKIIEIRERSGNLKLTYEQLERQAALEVLSRTFPPLYPEIDASLSPKEREAIKRYPLLFEKRAAGEPIVAVLAHSTQGTTLEGALRTLHENGTSYHAIITRTGKLVRFGNPAKRGSHALNGNVGTIGIAFIAWEEKGFPVTPQQLAAFEKAVADLKADSNHYPQLKYVVAHGDVKVPITDKRHPGEISYKKGHHTDPQLTNLEWARLEGNTGLRRDGGSDFIRVLQEQYPEEARLRIASLRIPPKVPASDRHTD